MKRTLRSITLAGLLATAGLFASVQSAEAGWFAGGFRGPHVSLSVGIGGPFSPGYVVTAPHVVCYRPSYGYGFWAPIGYGYRHPYWVPVHRYRTHWIVSPYGRFRHGLGRQFGRHAQHFGHGRGGHFGHRRGY
jgi:hypothetical protein